MKLFLWVNNCNQARGEGGRKEAFSSNRPYSYSRYWTGTSFQLRLMRGIFSNANYMKLFLIIFPRISLHCKLVPVQYREYEYGLLKGTVMLAAFRVGYKLPSVIFFFFCLTDRTPIFLAESFSLSVSREENQDENGIFYRTIF